MSDTSISDLLIKHKCVVKIKSMQEKDGLASYTSRLVNYLIISWYGHYRTNIQSIEIGDVG